MTDQPDPPAKQPVPSVVAFSRQLAVLADAPPHERPCVTSFQVDTDGYNSRIRITLSWAAGDTVDAGVLHPDTQAALLRWLHGDHAPGSDQEAGPPTGDLDAIERRAAAVYAATTADHGYDSCPICLLAGHDVPALVAEVRRLREAHEAAENEARESIWKAQEAFGLRDTALTRLSELREAAQAAADMFSRDGETLAVAPGVQADRVRQLRDALATHTPSETAQA